MWVFLWLGLLAPTVTGNIPIFSSIPPVFTRVNNLYNYVASAPANPPPIFAISGAPSEIAVSANGIVSGTPSTTGVFPVNITATNSDGSALQSFSLTVGSVPALLGAPVLTATVGAPYSVIFNSTGFPAPIFAFTGPSWMNQTGSVFFGVPAVVGVSPITVTATNHFGFSTKTWTLNVVGVVPVISGTPPSGATVGTPYFFGFSFTGTDPLAWFLTDAPSWLSINGTGALSGIPDTAGSYTIKVTATNSGGSTSTNFGLTVSGVVPSISGTPIGTANVNIPYSFEINVTGQPVPLISVSPSWLSATNGTIFGVPPVPGNFTVNVVASNAQGSDLLSFMLNVLGNAPSLTGGLLPTAIQDTFFSYTFPRTGVPLATCIFFGVPGWLTTNSTTCTISGTPNASAVANFNVTQSNSEGTDTKEFVLYVRGIISCTPLAAIANVSYLHTCTSSSQPAPTFSFSGAPGVTMSSTGVISGTPPSVGRFAFNVTISNSQEVLVIPASLLVLGNAAPMFISTPPSTAAANQQYTYEMHAQGRPDAAFTLVSGPAWMHLVDGNYLEGTPGNSDEGSIVVVVQASNGVSPNALQQFVLNIQPSLNPVIRSSCTNVAFAGVQYNCILSATGASPMYFLIGTAPSWLSMEGCCKLTGTPNASDVGSSSVVITASNSHLPNDVQSLSISVGLLPSSMPTRSPTSYPSHAPTASFPPNFASLPPTTVTIGSVYFYPINITGSPSPVISVSTVDLPPWLRLIGNILTGSPPAGTVGTATILLTATNGVGPDAMQSFVLAISNPPTAPRFLSAPKLVASVGLTYGYPVVATGTPTPNYTYSGPPFLSLIHNNGVVSLTGTPLQGDEGVHQIVLVATNSISPPDPQSFSLTVLSAITPQPTFAPTASSIPAQITSSPPISASAALPFVYVIMGTGIPTPTYTVTGLPDWLSFTSGNTISGAPPVGMSGSSTFKVIATQGGQSTAEQYVTVAINENGNAPFITSSPPLLGVVGSVYTYIVRATGTPDPAFLWTLPPWLTSSTTPLGDVITGIPTSAGNYTITVVASNGVSPAALQSFNLIVEVASISTPTNAPSSSSNSVPAAPVIISVPPSSAMSGSPFLYHVVAIGSPTPLLSTTQLPAWLHFSGCCDITGTVPSQATGSVTWTLSANNGILPAASQVVTLIFQNPPSPKFTSAPVTSIQATALYQYEISVQGYPTPEISVESLPSWLRLMGNILIGTAPSGTQGVIPVFLTASNGVGPDDKQDFLIIVEEQPFAPKITSLPAVLIVNNGSLFSYTITTSGNPLPTASAIKYPPWLTFSDTTSTLSGLAPQIGGRYEIVIEATNGILPEAQQTFTIEILSKPSVSLANAPAYASVGYIYSHIIEITANPPLTSLVFDGGNVSWLGLNGNVVSGSPPPGATGTVCYTVTASNSMGSDYDTTCFSIVAAASCSSSLDALLTELHVLLGNTRANCEPNLEPSPSPYVDSVCHQQCDHPVVLVNDLTIGISSGRRLMSRMLLALSANDRTVIANSAASQWGLPVKQVHTMSGSSSSEVRLFALTPDPLPSLSTVNNVPVSFSRQAPAAQSDMLALIADLVPQAAPQVASVAAPISVTADTAWYVYLIVMLLVATAVCWILFFTCTFRKDEEPRKFHGESIALEKFQRPIGHRSLEDDEIQNARLELEKCNRELEALQAVHEEAKAEATRKERAGQFEQEEVSRLLKQMVDLEATQQQQHAAQVAALSSEIAALKAKAGAQDARQGDRLAQAQQHEELKRLSEEYQKLKSDRALLQADDLKNQKKLLDTVENLTRALEKSRADSEEMRAAIEEEKRKRLAAENARLEREKQERVLREQERLLEEKARLLREQAERDRVAKERERVEKDRLQRERDRLEAERQRLASQREQIEKDRIEKERADALAREREILEIERRRLEAERLRAEKDRLEKERLAQERVALEKERLIIEKERLEKERLAQERAAADKEKIRLETLEKQRQEKEQLERAKVALEAEKARLAQERIRKEEERKKKELDAERLRLEQEKEKLARDREQLQRQQEERSARGKSPSSPDLNGFSEDSGIEDDSGGSEPEPQPMRFPKGPGLQDSDDDDQAGSKFKTLSRAQGGVLEQWKQREKAATELKAKEKRRAARRLARRKARHEARREARMAAQAGNS